MKINILTLFPEMFTPVTTDSILGKANEKGILDINLINIRDFSTDKHNRTDDTPFGGGVGMVMFCQPVFDALDSLGIKRAEAVNHGMLQSRDVPDEENGSREASSESENAGEKMIADYEIGSREQRGNNERKKQRILYMSPRGRMIDRQMIEELAATDEFTILCGHYEGVDQRIIDAYEMEEVSIGDYILTGGELPAMVLIDSVSRFVPGVLGDSESAVDESIYSGLLECDQYTKPRVYDNMEVPEVLTGGNHKEIRLWQLENSLRLTAAKRPDLLEKWMKIRDEKLTDLTKKERANIELIIREIHKK